MPSPRRVLTLLLAAAGGLLAPVVTAGTASATNDRFWGLQWAPPKVGAPSAWATTTGAGVRIGIVDSGVDLSHEDLQGKIVANAKCIGTGGNSAACTPGGGQDIAGHGTHVAGIAAANKDNGVGMAGIAPGAQLVVARVFEGESAELEDVEAGIRWVVDQGARVVNLSLGENVLLGGLLGAESSLGPALQAAWARGAIPVVAAGNAQLLSGSASYGDVPAVIVGATGPDDEIAGYSVSTGNAKWAIVAPGGNGSDGRQIWSTFWRAGAANQYGYLQGTSMATPHVSGALALLLSRPGVTPQRAVELLLATANRQVACGTTCAGRLDVAAAMVAAGGATAPPAAAPPPAAPARPAPATRAPTRPSAVAAPVPAPVPGPATTTLPPAPPPTEVVQPAPTAPPPTTAPGPLSVAAAGTDDDGDEVGAPGAAAAALLLLVGAGFVLTRRRAG